MVSLKRLLATKIASDDWYRESGILAVPEKSRLGNIQAMWKLGFRMVLVHRNKKGEVFYCYKRRGVLNRIFS